MVLKKVEYCSTMWSPHQQKYISKLEMVQRRAARFTLCQYSHQSSVTNMLKELQWESLAHRRMTASLILLQKVRLGLVATPLPPFFIQAPRPPIRHPHRYLPLNTRTEAYRNSFFPRTLIDWNRLPMHTATLENIDAFKRAMTSHTL